MYEIEQEDAQTLQYFGVNRANGELRVIQALNTDPHATPVYSVRIRSFTTCSPSKQCFVPINLLEYHFRGVLPDICIGCIVVV